MEMNLLRILSNIKLIGINRWLIFLLIAPIFICPQLPAQIIAEYVESDINFKLTRGIYLTYDEFIENNPSIQNDFYILDKEKNIHFPELDPIKFMEHYPFRNRGILYIDDNKDTITVLLKDIWGFSDGENVFFFKDYHMYRIKKIEIISEVEEWDKKYFFRARTPSDGENLAIKSWDAGKIFENPFPGVYENSPNPKKFNFLELKLSRWFLDLRTGNLFLHTKFCDQIENIIKDDDELFNQYKSDSIKYKREMYKAYRYYLKYCENNPVYFPVSKTK